MLIDLGFGASILLHISEIYRVSLPQIAVRAKRLRACHFQKDFWFAVSVCL